MGPRIRTSGWAIGGLLFPLTLAGCAPEPPPAPPNIVLVVHDTLRPDHLGFSGYSRETAPFLAKLARGGAFFPEALSTSSWTAPATASLLTSLYPTQHGVVVGLFVQRQWLTPDSDTTASTDLNRLPREARSWPELLRDQGYRTFGVTSNINIGSEIGFDRGFDRFHRLKNPRPADTGSTRVKSASASAEDILEQLIVWEDEILDSEPFFLYLHFNDVHKPYAVHKPWHRAPEDPDDADLAAYDSEIGYADDAFQRIHERFALSENTIVVVVSDHGEAFGEHGYQGHARGLEPEVQRTLLLISAPDHGVSPNLRPETVSLVDVLPTVFDLAGLAVVPGLEGRSLRNLVGIGRAPAAELAALEERPLFGHKDPLTDRIPDTWSVQKGEWKAVFTGGAWQLFDLTADPGEHSDVTAQHPEILRGLQEDLAAFQERARPVGSETTSIEMDRERVEILRSLGYVQ